MAAAIVALLVLHARAWGASQLLWACHVASLGIAIGLVLGAPRVVAVGLLFHVGEGIPAYVIGWIADGHTTIRSFLLHTVPLASSAWALWGHRIPRGILVPAWLLHPAAMVAAYLFADPALNVMLVHQPFAPTAAVFSELWIGWIANAAIAFTCVAIARGVLALIERRWR